MCVCVWQPTLIRLIQESAVEFRTTRKNDWVQSELVQDAALLIIHKLFIVIHRAVLVRHQGLRTVKLSLIVFLMAGFTPSSCFMHLFIQDHQYSPVPAFALSFISFSDLSVMHFIFLTIMEMSVLVCRNENVCVWGGDPCCVVYERNAIW